MYTPMQLHYDETGSHEDCATKGRQKVTSAAEDRVTSFRNHKLTAPQVSSSSRLHGDFTCCKEATSEEEQ